jgi:DNA mismatch endonuclease, patch repair protein
VTVGHPRPGGVAGKERHPHLRDRRRLRADIVFTRATVAVFIDGCFWHGCFEHHFAAKTNADFSAAKVTVNRDRDG